MRSSIIRLDFFPNFLFDRYNVGKDGEKYRRKDRFETDPYKLLLTAFWPPLGRKASFIHQDRLCNKNSLAWHKFSRKKQM